MSFQPNNYQQNYDELSRNVISNTGGMKYNQIKVRKKGVPIDKEKLYEENYELRNKVKQLEETNLKLKTQLAVTQKQKESLFNMAEEEMFHPKIPQRSHSGSHKVSSANPIDNQTNITLLKQKQNSAIKKLVRDKHNENEQLRFQNQNIKKTMKFTRLNELITENNELIEETKRLRLQIIQSRNYADQFSNEYSNKIQSLRRDLQQERDTEKKNGVELKKQFEVNSQLKEKLRESELKKVQVQRKLNKQLKALKSQNLELRSRISNQMIGRECQKPDCIKLRKQRYDLKRKTEQQQKQIKNLKDQNLIAKRQMAQRQYYYKSNHDSNPNHKNTQPKRPIQTAEHKITNHSGVSEKKQSTQIYQIQVQKSEPPIAKISQQKQLLPLKQAPKQKQELKVVNKSPSLAHEKSKESHPLPNKIEPQEKQSKKQTQSKPKIQNNKDQPERPIKKEKTVQAKNKTDESYNTQKLLESYAQSNQHKQEHPQKQQANSKLQKVLNQQEQYYNESQGQYQQIDFQEEQQENKQKAKSNSKKETSKKDKKTHEEEKPLEKKVEKVQKEEKKTLQEKGKSKSNKKVSKLNEGEQMLYQKEKKEDNQDDGKSQLKLIKQTLTYKFNAQGYTYDDLAKDLNQSGKKSFSVTEMMDILTEEPFLLSEEHIETIIIYLFETDNLTGEQTLPTKSFLKKIKKFIAKAKPLDKQSQEHNLSELIAMVQADEAGKKKIRTQCKKHDSGNGTVTKQNFIKIMQGMKVGNELLETAIAQIVYVSTDINNLNYDFFLKRFAQAQ